MDQKNMDQKTQIENKPNNLRKNESVDPEFPSPTSTNMKALDLGEVLDKISTNLFTVLKISIFMLLLLTMLFIL